ncbi:MAG TPA: hypothetical protein VNO70_26390, partial [Blastocatellia bacterium]|nr:hypothetical protein [Blastocatellia bacterium]
VALIVAAIAIYFLWINRHISGEQDQQAAAAQVQVQESRLRAPATEGFTLYLNSAGVRATAEFAGTRYLATSGGLIALDAGGRVKRRYTTMDGLPDNDLTALAVFRDRLFIGAASAGLLSFDGDAFTGYRFNNPKATRVSALVATATELLIGTLDGGLFEYDGERFTRRYNSATGADFNRVTALLPVDSRLYIGTQDRGLYVWREAHIEYVGTGEGLPSPHVTGLAALPAGAVAVATDFGVVSLSDTNEVKPISNQPNVTSLAVSGGRLWAGLFSGGIVDLSPDRNGRKPAAADGGSLAEVAGLPRAIPTTVYANDGMLWALTDEGAFAREERASGPAFAAVAASLAGERILTAAHITGLTFDGSGRLWVGYFDRGIDIIAPETGEQLSHIEDDRVREVNFLTYDAKTDRVLAATSRGLVAFDSRSKQTVYTREQNGVISNSIAHVAVTDGAGSGLPGSGSAIVLATAGGLTEISSGRARSLTAFHGLASNHLYTAAVANSRLYVGSLAGLVELEGLRVVQTYKTSNSKLSHDWVAALAEADGTLYIGTNGGGVDALLPTGEWVNFEGEVGRFEVNPNAMLYDGERLYVGTTDRGLLVYDTRERRWTKISAGLPSQSVTTIASDGQFVYVGTGNGMMRIEKRAVP